MSSANKLASLDSSVASIQLNNNGGASYQKQQASHGASKGVPRGHQHQYGQGQAAGKPRNTHKHHRKPESSLNHLLNFSYARPSHQDRMPIRRQARSTPSFGIGSGYHPDDKAHFVNANYRFVVHPSGDYRANLVQADLPVPWENVLQVLASAETQCSACPICLEAVPIAPRMAKCGHAFCLPCILRYLDSEDIKTGKSSSKWRKCPICFDGIYAKDLRPVKWFFGEDAVPSTGAEVTLRLFKRSSGSPHALPRGSDKIAEDSVPWHNQGEALDYARLVRADASYLSQEREREVDALYKMRIEDAAAFGDDGHWIDTALENIDDLATVFTDLGIAAPAPSGLPKANVIRPPIAYELSADAPTDFVAATAPVAVPSPVQRQPERSRHQPSPPSLRDHRSASKAILDASQDTPDAYYFYQPRTGAHAYLAGLDIRLLKRAFQDFEHFPASLMARVEHVTTVKIDADLRRRTKYLSHLPLGCEVTFLECDWQARLPAGVLEPFRVELDRRRKKRHDKAISEEHARQRAQKQEDRRQRMELSSSGRSSWLQDTAAIEDTLDFDDDSSYFARNETNTYDLLHHADSASPPTGAHLDSRSTTVWGTAATASIEPSSVEQGTDAWQEQIARFEEEAIASATMDAGGEDGKKARPAKKQKPKKLVLMSTAGARRV